MQDWPSWGQYALSIGAIGVALLARWLLDPLLGDRLPWVTIFIAMLPLVLLVRPAPFMAGAILGCLGIWYFIIPPRFSFQVAGDTFQLHVPLFVVAIIVATGAAWLSQRALRTSRKHDALLRAFVDDSPTCKWVTDAHDKIVYVNKAMAEAIGRPIEQILGRTYAEVLPPKLAQLAMEHIRAVRESGEPRMSFEVIEPLDGSGARRVLEWRRFALRVSRDDEVLVAGMANDVSERKRAEQVMRRNEADALLLQSISGELIRQDDERTILSKIIDGAATIMRSQFASMQILNNGDGHEASLKLLAHRGFTPQAAKFWDLVSLNSQTSCGAALKSGERHVISDIEQSEFIAGSDDLDMFRKTGIRSMQTTPLIARSGKLVGMLSTHWDRPYEPPASDLRILDILARQAADVLERTQTEAELRQHRDHLEQLVTRRTDEVKRAEKAGAANQRMAAVGTLASGLAHDINNILFAFSGRMDTILADSRLTGETRTDLTVIVALIDHLRQMSRNLSLFSRDPEQEGAEGRTDLARWVKSVQELIEGSLKVSTTQGYFRIKTVWDVPEELPQVGIAPHRLTQVVLNLVHNARDAILAKHGSELNGQAIGTITIEARSAERTGAVTLRITDDGCGMDDEVKRRCIEPYFTTRDRPGFAGGIGSGMGLALTVATIGRIGGEFDIESEPGKGTTISMTLPIAPEIQVMTEVRVTQFITRESTAPRVASSEH